jgi:hypothetical protein
MKVPFLFRNFDVSKKNLVKNVHCTFMTGTFLSPHPLRRQHSQETFLRCLFIIQNSKSAPGSRCPPPPHNLLMLLRPWYGCGFDLRTIPTNMIELICLFCVRWRRERIKMVTINLREISQGAQALICISVVCFSVYLFYECLYIAF